MGAPGETVAALRDALWAAACRLGEFTYQSLARETGTAMETVRRTVRGWAGEGRVVEITGNPHGKQYVWRVADSGAAAGLAEIRRETPDGNLWRAARGLRSFSPIDLAAHATTPSCSVAREDAARYCRTLLLGGYLRVLRTAVPGRREPIYRLVRDSGPVPPEERRVRAVWDGNLGEYSYLQGGAP